jgi:tricorn protease-like protein
VYPDNGDKIILWDVVESRELWSGTTKEFTNSSNAAWSQDKRRLIVATVNNDSEKLVYFMFENDYVEIELIPLPYFKNIELFSMSPDGRYISTWVAKDIFSTPELLLIDLDELKIVELCIEVNFMFPPVWSYDSKYVGVSGYTESGSETVIYSVDNLRPYKIPLKDVNLIAWLGE